MKDFTFKYTSNEPLPQLVYDNVEKCGDSRIDGFPMYKIDFTGKLKRVYKYINNNNLFLRQLKLKTLLGHQQIDDLENFELEIIEFYINEKHNIEYITIMQDHFPSPC